MVAGSKAQEKRDGGRLSAGGEMPVIADGDGESSMGTLCWKESAYCCGKVKGVLSAEGEVPVIVITVGLSSG